MKVWTYHWMHIRTGKTGDSLYVCETLLELLVFLNRCNSQNPGTWQYWQ